jgi:hypothetical protein
MKDTGPAEPLIDIDAWSKKFRKFEEALEDKLDRCDYVPQRGTAVVETTTKEGSYADKKLTKKTFEMILRKLRSLEETMNASGGKAAPDEHIEMDLQPV